MRSVFGTIIIFIALYIILYFDIFGFLAQSWVLYTTIGLVVLMLVLALFVLGLPGKKKGGHKNEKDTDLR